MKVLLVDDEIVALNSLKKRFDWLRFGYTDVLTAECIEEAKNNLQTESVDLLLCDIEMPGENGLDLVIYSKEHYPALPCIMVTCHAEFPYIQKALRNGVRDYLLKPVCEEELYDLLTKIEREKTEQKEQQKCYKMVQQHTLKQEMKEASMNKILADSSEKRIQQVQEYIEQHLQEPIAVGDLAGHVFINAQYLMRIFKKETGKSITEYITDRRIHLAGKLLRETEHTIHFISDCVGFESSSYFIRVFKRQTGYSPGEYRNMFKKQ